MAAHTKGLTEEAETWEAFGAIAGISVPWTGESLWGKYFAPELDEAVVHLVGELKQQGLRVVCATNTEPAHYRHHARLGHYDLFDAVYPSTVLHMAKPEKPFFSAVLAGEQVDATSALLVDDTAANCEAADSMGILSFLYADVVELRWWLSALDLLR
jgi:putative hydrolase of the HAD superfamily